MKVLLLSFWFTGYCIKLANELSKYALVKLMLPENIMDDTIDHLLPAVQLEAFKKINRRNPANLWHSLNICRSIKKYSPDIIHIQCNGHAWFCFMLPFIKRGNRIVFTIHDPVSHPGEETFVRNTANKFIRFIGYQFIVHAQKLKKQMISIHNMDPASINVIPMGTFNFHEDSPNPYFADSADNNVLFFGRIQDYKGIEYLIAAEPLIAKTIDNFKIIIAGKGKSIRPYLNMIKNRDRFIILNKHIPEKELSKLFKSASFLVLPYTEASQSGIIPLAYSYHKPVIATNVGGIPEIVDNYITGILVPPRNHKKLADAICLMLKDKKLTSRMGENAYRKQIKDLSWERIAQKTIEIYRRCF